MKTEFKATKPGEIDLTLTITMSLAKWQELASAIKSDWPGWQLTAVIRQMAESATKHFEMTTEDEQR